MACRAIDRLRVPGSRAIATAIAWRTQERAALDDLARDPDLRLAGVVAVLLGSAARISRRAASLLLAGVGVDLGVPVAGPLPDIANHVMEPVAVRRERRHRRGALEAVLLQILVWKSALPGIGHVLAAGGEFVTPGELGAVDTAARRQLPFGLGRQLLAGPAGVGERIREGHVHDRMSPETAEVAPRTVGVPPVRALEKYPPLTPITQLGDGIWRRLEHERAGVEHVRQCARVVFRVRWDFGESNVPGSVDELLELAVGHRGAVHPEAVHR